jgi:hypothetical protein
MSTRTYYHPRETAVDLAAVPSWLYNEIVSLHGHIPHPPAPPVLTCLGNGEPMYLVRSQSGRYFARHYPGSSTDGHVHPISTMSDEHRRQTEYAERAARHHGLDTSREKSTGNGTRLDLAISGTVNVGVEIQRSALSRTAAKSRTMRSFDAGWPTAWISDSETDPDWADHVPTAWLTTRDRWGEKLPSPNSVFVAIGEFTRERDRNTKTGWRYKREPRAVLLDELAILMPAGEIIPVAVGTRGQVSLAFRHGARCHRLVHLAGRIGVETRRLDTTAQGSRTAILAAM